MLTGGHRGPHLLGMDRKPLPPANCKPKHAQPTFGVGAVLSSASGGNCFEDDSSVCAGNTDVGSDGKAKTGNSCPNRLMAIKS